MFDLQDITNPRVLRKKLDTLLKVCMTLVSGFMLFKALAVVSNAASPAVVVLSGSMEPAFQRGDILFLWNNEPRLATGDVVVYDTDTRAIPIVHRVVHEHHGPNKQLLLTKGDNNQLNDLNLYPRGKQYIDRDADLANGKVLGYVPYVGYITILMAENPKIKAAILGGALLLTALKD